MARFHREGPRLYHQAYRTYDKWAKPKSAGSGKRPFQTRLSKHQEKHFRRWIRRNNIAFDVHAGIVDYDMRGYWKSTQGKGRTTGGHFTDKWKTPYDTSFSSESRYANKRNPLVWRHGHTVNRRSGRIFYKPK